MNEDEKMSRGRGEHLQIGEVKIEIIKYILSRNDILPGPDIIKYIKKKCGLTDETNIRTHLNDLADKNCIEKIPRKNGGDNKWKIEKLETLQNIRKYYPAIRLNIYEKSLDIILEEQITKKYHLSIDPTHAQKLRIQLPRSIQLFDQCLINNITTRYENVEEIYLIDKLFGPVTEPVPMNSDFDRTLSKLYKTLSER
jgi:predicted transcriptional regulator